MTAKWLSYRGVPLQGHLHVANQQQQQQQKSCLHPNSSQVTFVLTCGLAGMNNCT